MGIMTTIDHRGKTYSGEVGTIADTFLGTEDHGIFTFMLTFDFNGSGQGAGNYFLRENTAKMLQGVIDVLGVRSWEKLKGQQAVALREDHGGLIVGIANLDTGKAVTFEELAHG